MDRGFRPLKRYGQHFLKDQNIAKRIIESMCILDGDHVLEIGPGTGVLTELLLKTQAGKILCVEIDRRLSGYLRDRFNGDSRFQCIEKDFLDVELDSFVQNSKKLRVVGNIPYSITSPILFMVLENRKLVEDLYVTVQKEVGERIVSLPGTKVYGIPSVLFQVFADVEKLFNVSRDAFYPVPGVESLVLRFKFLECPRYEMNDEKFFFSLVKRTFGQRRKMLRNSLKGLIDDTGLSDILSVNLSQRPEDLSVEDFVRLSNELVTH